MRVQKITFLSFYELTVRCPNAMREITDFVKRLDEAFSLCAYVPEEMHIEIPDSLKPGETEVRISLGVSSGYTYAPTGEILYNTSMRVYTPQWHVTLADDRVRTGIFCRPLEEFTECTTDEMVERMLKLWEEKLPSIHSPQEVST